MASGFLTAPNAEADYGGGFDARAHEASELADFRISEPTTNAPSDELATMQHYGAPTASLDFSHSPNIALWFALKDSISGTHNDGSPKGSALWAIDLDWLAKTGQAMGDNGDSDVIAIQDVKYPHPRMIAQKCVLLVNRSPERTFSGVLLGMLLKSPIAAERQVVSKLVVRRDKLTQLLEELKEMGIDGESMLPTDDALESRRCQRLSGSERGRRVSATHLKSPSDHGWNLGRMVDSEIYPSAQPLPKDQTDQIVVDIEIGGAETSNDGIYINKASAQRPLSAPPAFRSPADQGGVPRSGRQIIDQ